MQPKGGYVYIISSKARSVHYTGNLHRRFYESLYLGPLLLLLIQCSGIKTEERSSNAQLPNQMIVLIIDKCPNYSFIKHPDPKSSSTSHSENDIEISYLDDSLVFHNYITNKIPKVDTVVWPVFSDLVEIEHTYRMYEKLSYLLQAGDSVLFTYENDFPKATVLNRKASDDEVNYEAFRRKKVVRNNEFFDGIASYHADFFLNSRLYLVTPEKVNAEENPLKTSFNRAIEEWEIEQEYLDSLLNTGSISNQYYDFFKEKGKIRLNEITIQFENNLRRIRVSTHNEGLPKFADWNYKDSLKLSEPIRFGFYRNILEKDMRERYKTIPWISGVNRRIQDYRMLFDSLLQDTTYDNQEKTWLLTIQMENIIKNFSSADVARYLKLYWSGINNNYLKNHLLEKYRNTIPPEISSRYSDTRNTSVAFDLHLLDEKSGEVDFQSFLKSKRGKLIYLDFWSSTCLPCLESMPYMHELMTDYSDQPVAFVYISLDKNGDKWKQAVEKWRLKGYEHNFRVDSSTTNQFLDQFNVNYIPRYMLYNQQGTLVHSMAYDPKTTEIRSELDSLLKEPHSSNF